MKLGNKIRVAREDAGFSQLDLCNTSGVSRTSIQSYESDKGNITIDNLEKIADALGVTIGYFLESEPDATSRPTVSIKYYPDIRASAGYGATVLGEESRLLSIDREFLQTIGLRNFNNLEAINVMGDSMEPFISNGETVIIERTGDARNNDIVIANIAGDLYVKQFSCDLKGDMIKLTSRNDHYMDIVLEGQEIEAMQVIGIIRAKFRMY